MCVRTQGRTHAHYLLCCPEGMHSKKAVLTGSNVFLTPSLLGAGYKCVNQIPDFNLGALLGFVCLFVYVFASRSYCVAQVGFKIVILLPPSPE